MIIPPEVRFHDFFLARIPNAQKTCKYNTKNFLSPNELFKSKLPA